MDETTKGYISYGDKLARLVDYQGSLWKGDYQRAKKTAQEALEKIDNINDQRVIKRYLKSLSIQGKRDITSLGLAIWILKVTK